MKAVCRVTFGQLWLMYKLCHYLVEEVTANQSLITICVTICNVLYMGLSGYYNQWRVRWPVSSMLSQCLQLYWGPWNSCWGDLEKETSKQRAPFQRCFRSLLHQIAPYGHRHFQNSKRMEPIKRMVQGGLDKKAVPCISRACLSVAGEQWR